MVVRKITKNRTEDGKKRKNMKGSRINIKSPARAIIIANGFIGDPAGTYKRMAGYFGFSRDDIVISADGGASNALKMGLVPDVVIGDMDSIKFKV
ncbi:MAG: hypothetical protein KAI62_05590, partial [Actinomycetia bacterium]|nr:hypothetical protein [Actinomycetes bacterium]